MKPRFFLELLLQDPLWAEGIDTDNNGFVDDFFGWNFRSNSNEPFASNDPRDALGHGTHVAGTIGAIGNNNLGVTGINWRTSLMSLKFLDENNQGDTASAISAINYATMMRSQFDTNVRVLNNSWGQPGGPNVALQSAIQSSGESGILFVAAAGNGNLIGQGIDNDRTPFYPASYDLSNVIAVAASDSTDKLAVFSNYGSSSVDIAAPGVGVVSTLPGGRYGTANGTSMATPHVSGAAALLAARRSDADATELRAAIIQGADPIGNLNGKISGSLRLNAKAALTASTFAPRATLVSAGNITNAGETKVIIKVRYKDDEGTEFASLDDSDLLVTRPGFSDLLLHPKLMPGTRVGPNTDFTVDYELSAPRGTWTAIDSGTYPIVLQRGEVRDIQNFEVGRQAIGSFTVAIADNSVFFVNTTIDSVDSTPGNGIAADANGKTSLRAAIQEANAMPGANTIVLPDGKYVLTIQGRNDDTAAQGDLDLTDVEGTLKIIGGGNRLTFIDATQIDRVIDVRPNTSLNIVGISLQNGASNSGGGLRNELGVVDLELSSVDTNQATTDGGGIYNTGTITIDQSVVHDNKTTDPQGNGGGGIFNNGQITIRRSTVYNNSTVGGLTTIGGGGGLFNAANGNASLAVSTISGNIARNGSGGGLFTSGVLVGNHMTITNNQALVGDGGGAFSEINNPNTVSFRSSIIAGNYSSTKFDINSTISLGDSNLIGVSNQSGSLPWNKLTGTLQKPLEPMLGPLKFDGFATPTHELLPGSPAIDAAPGFNLPASGSGLPIYADIVDQRGQAMSQDASSGTRSAIGQRDVAPSPGSSAKSLTKVSTGDTLYWQNTSLMRFDTQSLSSTSVITLPAGVSYVGSEMVEVAGKIYFQLRRDDLSQTGIYKYDLSTSSLAISVALDPLSNPALTRIRRLGGNLNVFTEKGIGGQPGGWFRIDVTTEAAIPIMRSADATLSFRNFIIESAEFAYFFGARLEQIGSSNGYVGKIIKYQPSTDTISFIDFPLGSINPESVSIAIDGKAYFASRSKSNAVQTYLVSLDSETDTINTLLVPMQFDSTSMLELNGKMYFVGTERRADGGPFFALFEFGTKNNEYKFLANVFDLGLELRASDFLFGRMELRGTPFGKVSFYASNSHLQNNFTVGYYDPQSGVVSQQNGILDGYGVVEASIAERYIRDGGIVRQVFVAPPDIGAVERTFGEISGKKILDVNGDGTKQNSEPGLPGWTIFADLNHNGKLDGGEPSTITREDDPGTGFVDETGTYLLSGILPGQYEIREVAKSGYDATIPAQGFNNVNVTPGNVLKNVDFGSSRRPGSLRGFLFEDSIQNEIRDAEEQVFSGWTVYLDTNGNAKLDSGELSTTSVNGEFSFASLDSAQEYTIRAVAPSEWEQVVPSASAPIKVFLPAGANIADRNFGFVKKANGGQSQNAVIEGIIYNDLNRNGVFDDGVGAAMQNTPVFLDANGDGKWQESERRTLTNSNGKYSFPGLGAQIASVVAEIESTSALTSPKGSLFAKSVTPLFNQSVAFAKPQSIVTADFNNDTFPDVAVAFGSGNFVGIRLNDGTGGFLSNQINVALPGSGHGPVSLQSGFFNNNTLMDLAVVNNFNSTVTIMLDFNGIDFASKSTVAVGSEPIDIASGKFNNDPFLDIAIVNKGSNAISILLNNGNGVFSVASTLASGGNSPSAIVTGQFTDDNADSIVDSKDQLDLAVVNSRSSGVAIFKGIGNGSFVANGLYTVESAPLDIVSADFDLNGVNDLAVSNYTSNTISLLTGSLSGVFQVQSERLGTANGTIDIAVADIENDGDWDIISSNLTNNNVSIFRNTKKQSATSAPLRFEPSENVGVGELKLADRMPIVVADFDHSGTDDIIAVPGATKALHLLKNSLINGAHRITLTGTESVTGFDFGTAPKVLLPSLDPISSPAPIVEDAAEQSINLTGIARGRSGSTPLRIVTTSDRTSLVSFSPSSVQHVQGNATGALKFTPQRNAFGNAVVTVTVTDPGADQTIDTTDDGVLSRSFTVSIISVNDAPTFAIPAGRTLRAFEDAGAKSIAGFVTGISAGGGSFESAQVLSPFTVTTDQPEFFSSLPTIDSNGRLTFTTATNVSGFASISVSLKDDGGIANGGIDVRNDQFLILVDAVNDAPLINIGGTQTVPVGAVKQTIPNFATGFSPGGGPDEASQVISDFLVTVDSPGLFSVLPAISNDGTLTFTPAADRSGIATVSVRVRDNGGTLNGGIDLSSAKTFTIIMGATQEITLNASELGPHEIAIRNGFLVVTAAGTTVRSVLASEVTKVTTVDSVGAKLFEVTLPAINLPGMIRFTGTGRPIELIAERSAIDLKVLTSDKLFGIELADLRAAGPNSLAFRLSDVVALNRSKTLRILMDSADTLSTLGSWVAQAGRLENGTWVQPFTNAGASTEVISATPWQNKVNRFDVDGDLTLSPLDVLVLVNLINANSFPNGQLPARGSTQPDGFFDPDGDNSLGPLDVLTLINEINRGSGAAGSEGEKRSQWVDEVMATELGDLESISSNPQKRKLGKPR